MIELTEHLLPHAAAMDDAFVLGVAECQLRNPPRLHFAKANWRYVRTHHGLQGAPPILTDGKRGNHKLAKAEVYTVGYTGKQHVQRINRLVVNACPHAGDCVKVCVLDSGRARFDPRIERARRARNELLVMHPTDWAYLIGRELGKVAAQYEQFLFRPNVATDVRWELILPSMTNGSAIPNMTSYGYSKWPYVLDTDGWLDTKYRVAYSWNERSNTKAVRAFQQRGGSVAVVTSRRKGEPVGTVFPFGTTAMAIDADLTDEWIFQRGVIGDLSAKGKARKINGTSDFVVSVN